MKRKQIIFTAPKTAGFLETDIPTLSDKGVLTKMEYTVVSGGTERANILGLPNIPGDGFPKSLGYCGVGHVVETGKDVKSVKKGDMVVYLTVESGEPVYLTVGLETEKRLKKKTVCFAGTRRVRFPGFARRARLILESEKGTPFSITGGFELVMETDED